MTYPLLNIIDLVPLNELPSHTARCPYCNSAKLRLNSSWTTLVGGGTGIDNDPNHVHYSYTCLKCHEEFFRETKNGNVWYNTAQSNNATVVKGIPSCFENYLYPCKCGGIISRQYKQLENDNEVYTLATSFTDGKVVRHYRTFYKCDTCEQNIKVDIDHWYGK